MNTDYTQAIIVNAVSIVNGGALTILKQFIANIPNSRMKWVVFISNKIIINTENSNTNLIGVPNGKPMFKRFLWDLYGLNKWLERNKISPIATISLQNTGFRVNQKSIPKYIYFHQSLPLNAQKWSVFNRQERRFWFYRNIYPFFIRLFLSTETTIIVQLDFIRTGFAEKFNHPISKIKVYSPTITVSPIENKGVNNNCENILRLLYPAMPYFYKNHSVLVDALKDITKNVTLSFTVDELNKISNDFRINYIGQKKHSDICEMYFQYDALLFPSYIETFGLPLIEAAMTGMPILAADLPYAREVLDGYEGVCFIPYNDPNAWANAINKLEKKKRFKPFDISKRKGWNELFDNILKDINQ